MKKRVGELQLDLMVLRAKLDAIANYSDTEGAHADGDCVMVDALRLLAEYLEPTVANEVRSLADRFDELSKNWWYA